jgi:hypothetical protein
VTRVDNSGIVQDGHTNVIGAVSFGEKSTATSSGSIHVDDASPAAASRAPVPGSDEWPADDSPAGATFPPYRAALVVDAAGFSDTASAEQTHLGSEVVRVLETAFARADLADAWADRRFGPQAHTGDGYTVGLRTEVLPRLIHPFLRELQEVLRERDQARLSTRGRLRLRASIHVGPLPDAGLVNDGVAKPMTDTHRLLDSAEVRQALAEAHEEITFLAVIVSRRVYEDVVEGGYTALHRDQFREAVATAKRFAEVAYLYLPQHNWSRKVS